MFEKMFTGTETFEAIHAAVKWCQDRGISVGRMEANNPRGLMFGDYDIHKWNNCTPQEQSEMDGTIYGDMRDGPVTVKLRHVDVEPEVKQP